MQKLLNPRQRKMIAYFLSFLMLFFTFSCHYYKVKIAGSEEIPSLIAVGPVKKLFVVHYSDSTQYILTYPVVKENRLIGKLESLDYTPVHYSKERYEKYNRNKEASIVNEVHVYFKKVTTKPANAILDVPIENIKEVRVIDPDKARSDASYVGVIALGAIGSLILFGAILSLAGFDGFRFKPGALGTMCPYIYTYDGQKFVFAGEAYTGAELQNLERHDYLALPSLQPVHHTYRLRIANELQERHFTDLAELIVVDHAAQDQVLLDRSGAPWRISDPQPAIKALSAGHQPLTDRLAAIDQQKFLFNEDGQKTNGLFLTFQRPKEARHGKLLVNAKNTLWLEYMLSDITYKMGTHFETWIEEQGQMTSSQRMNWMKAQEFPLTVSLQTDQGWQVIEYLPQVGPLTNGNTVIPIDLSALNGNEVNLRIETGYLFWEIDYAAMDFSNNQDLNLSTIQPSIAVGSNDINYTSILSFEDDNYLKTLTGDVVEIRYPALAPDKGRKHSYFLHTKGYYEYIRDFKHQPDAAVVNQLNNPGYFSTFSKEEYARILQQYGAATDMQ